MFLRKDLYTYEDALQIDGLVKAVHGQEIQETQNSCKVLLACAEIRAVSTGRL